MNTKNLYFQGTLLLTVFIFGLMTQNAQAQNNSEVDIDNAKLYGALQQLSLKLAEFLTLLESQPPLTFTEDKNTTALLPDVPKTDWELYNNEQYGFELQTPMYYFYDWLEDNGYTPQGWTGNSLGKNYQFKQLAGGQIYQNTRIEISIIEKLGNPLLQPFGKLNQFYKTPTIHTGSATINGVDWELFYNPQQTMGGCEYSFAQTLMPNNDVLQISISDENEIVDTQCPGTLETSHSQYLLKQILSTFNFSETS